MTLMKFIKKMESSKSPTSSLSSQYTQMQSMNSPSSRILYDVPCKVCSDHSSGKHYGIFACDGCAGFFKRSIRRSRNYVCKAKTEGKCMVDKTHRNQCRACRLRKCVSVGMNKDAVQHERGPRNSTLRRQMAMFMNKDMMSTAENVKSLQHELILRSLPVQPTIPPYILDLSARNRSTIEQNTYPTPMMSPYTPIATSTDAAIESICEGAAQLLFMNIRWMKTQCEAAQLHINDQLTLLEQTWSDLFILGAAQYLLQMNFNPMLCAYKIIESGETEKFSKVLSEAQIFQNLLIKMTHSVIDEREYACLRSIILYNINNRIKETDNDKERLREPTKISSLQSEAITDLVAYMNIAKSAQPMRYKNLMFLLEQFKDVSSTTIEELFFRRTIGEVGIVKVILDMYSQGKI